MARTFSVTLALSTLALLAVSVTAIPSLRQHIDCGNRFTAPMGACFPGPHSGPLAVWQVGCMNRVAHRVVRCANGLPDSVGPFPGQQIPKCGERCIATTAGTFAACSGVRDASALLACENATNRDRAACKPAC